MKEEPLSYRHLCVIAREELAAAPTMDDFEWRERIKCRLVMLDFAYPPPDRITAAMEAVERAMIKAHVGLRLVRRRWTPPPAPATPAQPLTRAEARHCYEMLREMVGPLIGPAFARFSSESPPTLNNSPLIALRSARAGNTAGIERAFEARERRRSTRVYWAGTKRV